MKNRVSLILQQKSLKKLFPDSTISRIGEKKITWEHTITPSPLSNSYKVKMEFSSREHPKIYILDPKKLKMPKGKKKLPHVYSHNKQKLCLYYPKWNEWTPIMLISKTIVPWTSEWLYHYEIWVATGVWNGGGIEH